MKKLAATLLLAAITVACAKPEGIRYFPAGTLETDSILDAFRSRWYSRHLAAMREPILYASDSKPSLRFTWLRTFDHPIAIRVVFDRSSCQLIATELTGEGGYESGNLHRRVDRALEQDACARLATLLSSSELWQPPPRTLGLDGSEWIIESSVGEYRVVRDWSPKAGPIRSLGLELIGLSGWSDLDGGVY
jgi:hypothetical protein